MNLNGNEIKWLYLNSIYTPSVKYFIDEEKNNFVYVKKIQARDFTAFPIGKDVVFVLGADISQPTGLSDILVIGFVVKKSSKTNIVNNELSTSVVSCEYTLLGETFQVLIYKMFVDYVEVIPPPELSGIPEIIKGEKENGNANPHDHRYFDD